MGLGHAQEFVDPGFESYNVGAGGFVKPTAGPWLFSNDAGVVEPYSPNSSTSVQFTWSATFAALEGQQYASTYAGSDSLRQVIAFSAPGQYRISVHAAAPNGTVAVFPNTTPAPVVDGEFRFTFNHTPVGNVFSVPKGSTWELYSALFTVARPGNYEVGVLNTRVASYFINYDGFAIESVPEPTAAQLLLVLGICIAGGAAIRRQPGKK